MKEATNQSGLFVGGLFACPVCMREVPESGKRLQRVGCVYTGHMFLTALSIALTLI